MISKLDWREQAAIGTNSARNPVELAFVDGNDRFPAGMPEAVEQRDRGDDVLALLGGRPLGAFGAPRNPAVDAFVVGLDEIGRSEGWVPFRQLLAGLGRIFRFHISPPPLAAAAQPS